jgi:hypothetical protein
MEAPRILYCHCAYANVIPGDTKSQVLDGLVRSGIAFEAVPDLCEMAARRDPRLLELSAKAPLKIAACYPRAVQWLFASAGAKIADIDAEVVNMRTDDAQSVLRRLTGELAGGEETGSPA